MFEKFVKFPIAKNDGKALVALNCLQKKQIAAFCRKIESGEYRYIKNPCLCGNDDKKLDILVTEKDRYGLPCVNLLCRKCGLIRLKERLDEYSTSEFYKNEYRDIYVGKELASDVFFISQALRGKKFYNLIKKCVDMNEITTVFEIGCGAGGILYPFNKRGKDVSGCDFGEKYLHFGKEKGLNLYQGEFDLSRTPPQSQDLIILSHVMEHFNDPLKTVNEIIELIGANKYLLVEVPGIFDIKKSYSHPILYFQNAHVNNYYLYFLRVFFETLGLDVLYGDERCTLLLRKPANWVRIDALSFESSLFSMWSEKVESELKKVYLLHTLKLNIYYYKILFSYILEYAGIKNLYRKLRSRE